MIGIGDSNYDTFCFAGFEKTQNLLLSKGCVELLQLQLTPLI